MTFMHRPALRLAAALALAVASASAFAQSAEYRRGYDDGFAAGQRAAHDDRGGRPGWRRLTIDNADYGGRRGTCDARRAVWGELESNNGNVRAGNQLCGDPAHGERKRLRVVYRCGDSEPMRAVVREGEVMRLSCRR